MVPLNARNSNTFLLNKARQEIITVQRKENSAFGREFSFLRAGFNKRGQGYVEIYP